MPNIRAAIGNEYSGAVDKVNYTSDPKSKELGPFTAAAELTNGRAAMMGLISLLAVESFTKTPLF